MTDERQSQGFGHSQRRVWTEIGTLVIGFLIVIVLGYWLISVAASELVSVMPSEVDVAVGEATFGMLAGEDKRCTNPALKQYIVELAAPLIEVANAPYPFHFEVMEDDAINAFALPGGYVVVNLGLIRKANSGDEIAGVLAHELQHALQRHGLKRIARQIGAAATVGLLLGWLNIDTLSSAAAGLVARSYDREQESEADRLGRQLLLDAGIKPDGMALFFERLAAQGPSVPVWLSTHPDSGERAKLIRDGPQFEGRPRTLAAPGDWPCHLENGED